VVSCTALLRVLIEPAFCQADEAVKLPSPGELMVRQPTFATPAQEQAPLGGITNSTRVKFLKFTWLSTALMAASARP
jgi:hypothetical protein